MGEKDLKRGESLDGWQSREMKRKLLPLLVAASGLLLSGCGSNGGSTSGGSSSTPKPPNEGEIISNVTVAYENYLRVNFSITTNGLQVTPSCTYDQKEAKPGYQFDCYINVIQRDSGPWQATTQNTLLLDQTNTPWQFVFVVIGGNGPDANEINENGPDVGTVGPIPITANPY